MIKSMVKYANGVRTFPKGAIEIEGLWYAQSSQGSRISYAIRFDQHLCDNPEMITDYKYHYRLLQQNDDGIWVTCCVWISTNTNHHDQELAMTTEQMEQQIEALNERVAKLEEANHSLTKFDNVPALHDRINELSNRNEELTANVATLNAENEILNGEIIQKNQDLAVKFEEIKILTRNLPPAPSYAVDHMG